MFHAQSCPDPLHYGCVKGPTIPQGGASMPAGIRFEIQAKIKAPMRMSINGEVIFMLDRAIALGVKIIAH
jgi:hypothetical protein